MKILDELLAGNPVTAIANAVNTAGMITLQALPTSEERMFRMKLNEAKIRARSLKGASKAYRDQLMHTLKCIEKGIRKAKKHKRPLDELYKDFDAVMAKIGDIE